jgi:hypothetical protein
MFWVHNGSLQPFDFKAVFWVTLFSSTVYHLAASYSIVTNHLRLPRIAPIKIIRGATRAGTG